MCLLGLNLAVDDRHDAGAGDDLVAAADLLLGGACHRLLMVLAAPMLTATLLMGALDRTVHTGFFIAGARRQRVPLAEPVLGVRTPRGVRAGDPGLRDRAGADTGLRPQAAVGLPPGRGGHDGVALFSFFVWQHHLFVSGINADLRPFYMLSTEIISLPTGFTFLCVLGTLWRGRIRLTVPMLFCLGWAFNFLFGGISGVFNSDVPSDVTTHGSFFVMAHFHYTIMGGLIFSLFAAIYYWGPKMTGYSSASGWARSTSGRCSSPSTRPSRRCSRRLPGPATARDHLPVEPPGAERLGVHLRLLLGLSMLFFLFIVVKVAALRPQPGGGQPLELQVVRVVSCRRRSRRTTSTRSRCSAATRTRTGEPGINPAVRAGDSRSGLVMEVQLRTTQTDSSRSRREWRRARCRSRARMWCGATAFFFAAFLFAYFYLRSLDTNNSWTIGARQPLRWLGRGDHVLLLLSGLLPWLGGAAPGDAVSTGVAAILLALLAVVSAVRSSTPTLGFGPTQRWLCQRLLRLDGHLRRSAALGHLLDARPRSRPLWRGRAGTERPGLDVMSRSAAGWPHACSFFWTFFVAIGVIMFVVLYLV